MHLSIRAVGSGGDMQPYLALGLGLKSAGYQGQLCAGQVFKDLVTTTGLNYPPVTAAPVNYDAAKSLQSRWPFRIANQLFINPIKPIVTQCRCDMLGLAFLLARFLLHLDLLPLPIIDGFSPNLLTPPADWGGWLKVNEH